MQSGAFEGVAARAAAVRIDQATLEHLEEELIEVMRRPLPRRSFRRKPMRTTALTT